MKNGAPAGGWIGLDLGGTKMRAAAYDDAFNVLARSGKRTRGNEGASNGMNRIFDLLDQLVAKAQQSLPGFRPAGIGLGCPGPVNPLQGSVGELVNLGWRDVNLVDPVRKRFGGVVVLMNDVDAGTYGEALFGAARGARRVLGVFPGTGVGGGFVVDGNPLDAGTISCMELGHIPVLPDGPLCGCGQRGCLETVSSRLAINQAAALAAYRGLAPHLLAAAGTDIGKMRSRVLAHAIAAGDTVVENIVRDAARWLGLGLAGVINLLAPDVVVLGGGLVEALPKLYLKTVSETATSRVMQSFRTRARFVIARLGDDAVIRGAAARAREVRMSTLDST